MALSARESFALTARIRFCGELSIDEECYDGRLCYSAPKKISTQFKDMYICFTENKRKMGDCYIFLSAVWWHINLTLNVSRKRKHNSWLPENFRNGTHTPFHVPS